MQIWFIKTGENLPIDGENVRLLRTGILSELLSEKGYNVTWWTATFDHFQKKNRFDQNEEIEVKPNYKINLLHSKGYQKNVSIDRIKDHKDAANNFLEISANLPKPDIIIASMPTLDLCVEGIKYAQKYKIPILIDIRDLWPDIFIDELLPKFLHKIARLILFPLFNQIKFILKNATGIISITQPMLNWGLQYANRTQMQYDAVFPLAYLPPKITTQHFQKAINDLDLIGISRNGNFQLRICLVGSFTGYKFDLDTVIDVAKKLFKDKKNVQFILAGSGEKLAYYQEKSAGLNNIIFPGWINSHQIAALYSMSDIGLAPYKNSLTYSLSIPTKAIEYMSSKLALLSCLKGHLEDFITKQNCGYIYDGVESLYHSILAILENPSELEKKKNSAFQEFQKKFSGEIVYNQYIEHILKTTK